MAWNNIVGYQFVKKRKAAHGSRLHSKYLFVIRFGQEKSIGALVVFIIGYSDGSQMRK